MKITAYKSGGYIKAGGYSWFNPSEINHDWKLDDPEIPPLLEKASLALGSLRMMGDLVPNINLFIQSHITIEAVLSSRIEGTSTNVEQALGPRELIRSEARDDWDEVNNYTKATNEALTNLMTLPLSSRLIRLCHRTLLDGVRGKHKMPGEFRTSQNWIGGATLKDAVYIPPSHTEIQRLMSDLEKFIHNEGIQLPVLVKVAIAHYQFETIHPFLDGNGRVGRLLIMLQLIDQQIILRPLLYLSAFFEANRQTYYAKLMMARTQHDLVGWVKFVLIGIEQTANKSTKMLTGIIELKLKTELDFIQNWGRRSRVAYTLLNHLFQDPYVTIKQVADVTSLSIKSAGTLVAQFVTCGLLKEITGNARDRFYCFDLYIRLLNPDAELG